MLLVDIIRARVTGVCIAMCTRRIIRRHFQIAILFVVNKVLATGVKVAFVEAHIFADG